MQDWLTMTASDLGRGIGEGNIDPLALTETYLETIDAHPLRDQIYARVTADRARAEARAAQARARAGQRLSLWDGVPISWKDLFDTAGIVTEAGSALLKGRTPQKDAPVLAKVTAMGVVCLGKSHMSELAFSGLGYNPITATPPCVNDPSAVPGGSSSGAAASVAFGLAACGIGSDTGGSVRIPSAWNDLVGLKTTSGRLTLDGVVPLCKKFDTIGPIARSVEDAAHALALMEGRTTPDLRGSTLKGKRFAALRTVALDAIQDAPRAAYFSAIDRLQAAGASVEAIDIDIIPKALDLSGVLYTSEAYGQWKDVIEANPGAMFDQILERFRAGAGFAAADYVAAWHELERYRQEYLTQTASYDAVLLPTSPILPPNLERLNSDHDYYIEQNLLALRNTRIGNLMGVAGLNLPTGVPSCGITLMVPPMDEDRLLRLGKAAENALA